MSEDIINEISKELAKILPDDPQRHPEDVTQEQKQEIIQLLQHAAEEIGESPSSNEFNSLDLGISARKIQNVFGSWNEAKQEAGLETYNVGRGKTGANINSKYFESIDSEKKAYWLGAIFSTSSLQSNSDSDNDRLLKLNRIKKKEHFVTGFAQAAESSYAIQRIDNPSTGSEQVSLSIGDRKFINCLIAQGYPSSEKSQYSLPDLSDRLHAPFLRGYVEASTRGFSGNPMRIQAKSDAMAKEFRQWLESFGVRNASVTERQTGVGVNISNAFNIKSFYEALWADGHDTEPSYSPYSSSVLKYLEEEYPYPENIDYLSE